MKKLHKIVGATLLAGTLVACGGSATYKDGTYTGEAAGFDEENPVKAEVTVTDGKIANVEILEHGESVDKVPETQEALDKLPGYIVEKNSTDVDGIVGATATSNGIKGAVNNALEEAK